MLLLGLDQQRTKQPKCTAQHHCNATAGVWLTVLQHCQSAQISTMVMLLHNATTVYRSAPSQCCWWVSVNSVTWQWDHTQVSTDIMLLLGLDQQCCNTATMHRSAPLQCCCWVSVNSVTWQWDHIQVSTDIMLLLGLDQQCCNTATMHRSAPLQCCCWISINTVKTHRLAPT